MLIYRFTYIFSLVANGEKIKTERIKGMKEREMIVMPRNYVKLSEAEMEFISGGINIGMSRIYLDKNAGISQGRGIIRTHNWKNVTALQLAKEIYSPIPRKHIVKLY